MQLDYIRSFCKVVKVKSITKAAGELHLSQPALSLQINCLESQFGTKLLERTNRGVKLTASGELVYRHGLRLLKILDTLDQDLHDMRNPVGRSLKITASPYPGSYILPLKILDFAKDHPESKLSVTIKPVREVIENLIDRTTNVGVISGPISPDVDRTLAEERITCHSLGYDSIAAVCHPDSQWFGKEYSLDQLPRLPLILLNRTFGSRAAIEQGLKQYNLSTAQMNIVLEMENCAAIANAVKAHSGIGLMPRLACASNSELEEITVRGLDIPVPVSLLVNSALGKTPAIQELISFLSCLGEESSSA